MLFAYHVIVVDRRASYFCANRAAQWEKDRKMAPPVELGASFLEEEE